MFVAVVKKDLGGFGGADACAEDDDDSDCAICYASSTSVDSSLSSTVDGSSCIDLLPLPKGDLVISILPSPPPPTPLSAPVAAAPVASPSPLPTLRPFRVLMYRVEFAIADLRASFLAITLRTCLRTVSCTSELQKQYNTARKMP